MTATSLAALFAANAATAPSRLALAITRPGHAERVTFAQLAERAERFSAGLRAAGLRPGDRILLATSISVDFYALLLAVSGSGMTTVLVDGSLDRRRLLNALRSARARAIVGDRLHRWWLVPTLVRMRRYAPGGPPWGVRPLSELVGPVGAGRSVSTARGVPSSISFTSGSTGRAKGVVRTGDVALAQHRALLRQFPVGSGDVDMPCFPAVVVRNLAAGVTSVLPPIDLRHPGAADPAAVAECARRMGVTSLSGAPAYTTRLVDHLLASGTHLPQVRRVVVGGAPVTRGLSARVLDAFPGARGLAVYGSTEIEPIAVVDLTEIAAEAHDHGLLVGAPVPQTDVRIVELPDRVDGETDVAAMPRADVGEVIVRGAGVSRAYIGDPEAFARYKLREPDGSVWHRTGDIGRVDALGRLRLLGRRGQLITHRGRVLFPLALEAVLSELPGIDGAALVAHRSAPEGELAVVARDAGALSAVRAHLRRSGLDQLAVRRVASIPTDPRHNSKVDRAVLARRLARGG
jgi:acyl-CoA synthetase (AMP-forming)/AMP-acid ligase II